MKYQLHFAINLREITWFDYVGNEIYYNTDPAVANKLIDFKASLQIAEHDGHSEYQPDLAHEVLTGIFNKYGTSYREVSKEEWLNNYRAWRKYFNQNHAIELDICPNG